MSLNLKRMFRFKKKLIKMLLRPGLIGTYVLYVRDETEFTPIYVGRSDTDLRRRLMRHPLLGIASHFEYDVHRDSENAFTVECANYHAMRQDIINKIHPAEPSNKMIKCPFCNNHLKRLIC